jgi:LmbE family N-acetylglucosaminyl deacetylase
MSRTVVFFHAHPDDEVLLTGGTMARLAAEGHRVVLVTATAGEAGLTAASYRRDLGGVRQRELHRAAAILGCARVELLGYRDSGSEPNRTATAATFASVPVDQPADRLAALLREESADVLTGYDAAGGYGHPDHLQVHRVARRAAAMVPRTALLEATVDRRALRRALQVVHRVRPGNAELDPSRYDRLYSAHDAITHCVDVTAQLPQKRAAMRAHASQAGTDGGGARTLDWVLRLPAPVYRLAFRREWFVQPGCAPGRPVRTQLLP